VKSDTFDPTLNSWPKAAAASNNVAPQSAFLMVPPKRKIAGPGRRRSQASGASTGEAPPNNTHSRPRDRAKKKDYFLFSFRLMMAFFRESKELSVLVELELP